MKTDIRQHEVRYTVWLDGQVLWRRVVKVSPQCPAGGPAFQDAAREQERFAREYIQVPPVTES